MKKKEESELFKKWLQIKVTQDQLDQAKKQAKQYGFGNNVSDYIRDFIEMNRV